jgi:hypothetical protein
LYSLKYIKALVDTIMGDVRHILQASHLTACSMSHNEAIDICYWVEIHVNIIHLPLHLLCNARATKTITKGLPTMTCGWIWSRSTRFLEQGM